MNTPTKFWNPYLAGFALGLVLLATFLIMGKGLGASGGVNRVAVFALDTVASSHADNTPYMARLKSGNPNLLDSYFVFEILGVFLGGSVSAFAAGRLKRDVVRGPNITVGKRLMFAITGGVIMGVAARLARGCTSGQALTGGAILSVGSWVFMLSVFAGGYALAYFVRRQWT